MEDNKDINVQSVEGQAMTVFNVLNFGAIGDGIADDTLAIQKAVSKALNVRGTVYIPNGKYRITATINCIPVWGVDAGSGKDPNGKTLSRSGCNIRGEHRRGTVIFADFDNWQTININGENVCQYYLENGNLKPIVENQYGKIQKNLTNKIVFYHAEYMHFSDMWIIKKDAEVNPNGIAFSTPYNTQTGWSVFERMTIELFNYGFWHRFTLYNSFRDIVIQSCRVGIRFARIDDRFPKNNNNNPIAINGWNGGSTGWFHNVVLFDNCSIKGNSRPQSQYVISPGVTEIGFWGSPMGAIFNSCTFENIHRNTEAKNNVIAPIGTPGTGIYIEDGTNNGEGKGITINQLYTEVTERPIYFTDTRDVNVNGGFMQGAFNNISATSSALEFNKCQSVNITGNLISSGAFKYFIKATNNTSVSYENFTGGYRLSGDFSSDSTSKINQISYTDYLTEDQLNTLLQTKVDKNDIGILSSLNTVNKVIVGAINEVNQKLNNANQKIDKKANQNDIGSISILNTTNKVLVNAVNEVNEGLDNIEQKMGKVNTNIQISSPKSKWYNKKIVCIGDSITYGLSPTGGRVIAPWVEQLKSILNLSEAINYGISGSTVSTKTSDSNWNKNRNPMCLRYSNMNNDADIVTCLGGINDFWLGVPLGNFGSRDTNTFYGALHALYLGLIKKYPTKVVFIMTCNKVLSSKAFHPQGISLKLWTDAQREVAEHYSIPVLDLYKYSGINPNIEEQMKFLVDDGLHPNQSGIDILARKIAGFIERL